VVNINDQRLTAISWHAPNVPGDGLAAKMAAFEAMAAFITAAPTPVILGADLNTWRDSVDSPPIDPLDGFYREHVFVDPGAAHGLHDAYRMLLTSDGRLDKLRSVRPGGPLATSYVLSDGSEHRMDRIYASSELQPVDGGYDYAGAVQCGSDHALHWMDFA
jgi:hypothetical protein